MNNFKDVDGKYFYFFFSKNFIKEVEKYTAKSSVDSVRRAMIADMEFTHPQLPEHLNC
jgi:type I restriction enzyme S subunit